MNYKDFGWWLQGFLSGKENLDKGEITTILTTLRNVKEETKIQTFPPNVAIPRRNETLPSPYTTDLPKPPFNPTCEVDKIIGPGYDNYGRDK